MKVRFIIMKLSGDIKIKGLFVAAAVCFLPVQTLAAAVDVPSSADVGRIKPEEKLRESIKAETGEVNLPEGELGSPAPEGSDKIRFVLKELKLEGAAALPESALKDIYEPYIGTEISLAEVFKMADQITRRYRDKGYFLSLAYVPAQSIKTGTAVIKIVEGRVAKVTIDGEAAAEVKDSGILKEYISRLQSQSPLTSDYMESFLLRINDLPGYSFTGVLSVFKGGNEGEVALAIVASEKSGSGNVNFDNYSSRFLGPNQISAFYSDSFLPMQQTSISAGTSLPANELQYGSINHSIVVAPDLVLDLTTSLTNAEPGYTLKQFDVESDSVYISASLSYQAIRQRQENLSLKLALDGRNSSTDAAGVALTRDRIRAVRASASYDVLDEWRGYNIVNATLTNGIDAIGSSSAGDLNLSRGAAEPDFRKAELSLTRLQNISTEWSVLLTAHGQYASGPLFSSEEFGYGGQSFGRAYDSSEISGDHGMAAAAELRYDGLDSFYDIKLVPYAFYDGGVVWNDDKAQIKHESGTSTGFGVKAYADPGISANLGLAWPLTRSIGTPIYGQEDDGPRILLQLGKSF